MWQRMQTIFLVIAVVAMLASIFIPLWVYHPGSDASHELYALHYTVKEHGVANTIYFPYSITAIMAIASATLALISIGKYKNRLLQRKLGALNSLFIAATVGCAYYFVNQLIKSHVEPGQLSIGFYIPLLAILSNLLANRFIMKDEKLVRDSDRLR